MNECVQSEAKAFLARWKNSGSDCPLKPIFLIHNPKQPCRMVLKRQPSSLQKELCSLSGTDADVSTVIKTKRFLAEYVINVCQELEPSTGRETLPNVEFRRCKRPERITRLELVYDFSVEEWEGMSKSYFEGHFQTKLDATIQAYVREQILKEASQG